VFARCDRRRWNPELYRRLVAFVRDVGGELRNAADDTVGLASLGNRGSLSAFEVM